MSALAVREPAVAVARRAVARLCAALGVAVPRAARPGAPGLLPPPTLLRAADGWVHPGPPSVRETFETMIATLGGDVAAIPAEVVDAEAGAWMLPAVAVRRAPAAPPAVAWPVSPRRLDGARVVVLGATWAAPLTGVVLAELGADVVRVTHPTRLDPFALHDALLGGQRERPLDLDQPAGRDGFAALLTDADLLVDATTPRVLVNAGLPDPPVPVVRIAAFREEDRPGYGIAAECRGGWAARHDPPWLGRTSVADPVAGLLAAVVAVDVLASGTKPLRARVSLEDAVGFLFAVEGVGA